MNDQDPLRSYAIRLARDGAPGVEHLFMLPDDAAAIEEAHRILLATGSHQGADLLEVTVGCAGPTRVRWLGAWLQADGGPARWSRAV